jgi:hypothetical protein
MYEFCSFGPNSNNDDNDSRHFDFAGFFSADAVKAAAAQAQRNNNNTSNAAAEDSDYEEADDDGDSDGT